MAAGWSVQETRVLVSIWEEADVQSQLDGVVRNKVVYEKIIYWLTSYMYIVIAIEPMVIWLKISGFETVYS